MTTSGSGPRPPRRPNLGARTPTSRPRKVAGRAVPTADPEVVEAVEVVEVEPDGAPGVPGVPEAPETVVAGSEPDPDLEPQHHDVETAWPVEDDAPAPRSRRLTTILVVAIVLLVAVASAEAWYLWGKDDPVVSAQRPVVTGTVTHTSAVDAAAKALVDIVSASYKSYDDQVELAASRMTDSFAADFRETKADVKKDFIAQKTEVTAEVAAQGVVQASPQQVVALVFLDQSTTKAGSDLNVAQYKILVTVVRTDSGWLVSDVQTL